MSSAAPLPHTTPADESEAVRRQERLRRLLVLDEPAPAPEELVAVAGVDVAYDDTVGVVAAAAAVLDARTLQVVETATAAGPVSFPYVPGLLAYRELPAVLEALDGLRRTPDLVVCDGYGLAHPRRFGLACHLGVLTGLRTMGVAKTPFAFRYRPPGPERGDATALWDVAAGPESAEEVGRALRTRAGVKPVFVSVGHRMTLPAACDVTLRLAPEYRLPETTRVADRLCRRAIAAATASTVA